MVACERVTPESSQALLLELVTAEGASEGLPDDHESGERRGHGEDGQHRDLDVDRVVDPRREVVSIDRPVGDEVGSEPVVELVDHGLVDGDADRR